MDDELSKELTNVIKNHGGFIAPCTVMWSDGTVEHNRGVTYRQYLVVHALFRAVSLAMGRESFTDADEWLARYAAMAVRYADAVLNAQKP